MNSKRYRLVSFAWTIGVLVLLVATYMAIDRLPWRLDLTADRAFSLAPQTEQVLAGIEQPLVIRAFMRQGGDPDQVFIRRKVDDVLQQYAQRQSRIDYKMLDPDLHPEEALAYGIAGDGTIVFHAGERRKNIMQSALFHFPSLREEKLPGFVGEGLFTNAIITVMREESSFVCLLAGHGERQLNQDGANGLGRAVQELQHANYEVETITFETDKRWQQRCDVLLIAGPRLDFHPLEDAQIVAFLRSGKALFLMMDPQSEPRLPQTLQELKVSFHDSVVFDPEWHFIMGEHYPAPRLLKHEITEPITAQQLQPVFYLARPLIREEGNPFQMTDFLATSSAAWGETTLKSEQVAKPDPKQDLTGPLTLGIAMTRTVHEGIEQPVAILMGDSNFITNNLIKVPGNRALLLNSVAWLIGDREQIAIRPHRTDFRPLILKPTQARWVSVFTQLLFPGLILGGGLGFWWRRRRR